VLRTAVAEAATWAVPLRVAVNVSPLQMLRPDFPELVAQQLRETGLPPARLELEITESTLIEDKARVRAGMDALRRLGVQLAMDDFGTGYASIAMLRFFPFDTLKLDRSFLRDLESDAGARAILEAMIGLGRGLGMAVLVEGVETASQRDWLRAAGCDHGQGYLFGRPAPIGQWADGLPAAASAEQPQRQPGQQQEGGEGQPPAVPAARPGAAPQGAPGEPRQHHRDQPDHQGQGQHGRVQHGQHQGQLHVAAAQHPELPGRQQGERGDHRRAKVVAFRPAPEQDGQQREAEAGQHQPVADAPRPQVLQDAEQRPAELGDQQRAARQSRPAADALHAPPPSEPAASEAPRAGAGKAPAPPTLTTERSPR
jgi:EAL domain-containing protein (putative c-di-GMP-specific phosphodiesterase class I)